MKINKLPEGCCLMSNKISKKIAVSLISVLVFGSQLPSGSACPHDASLSAAARAKANENNIELKGIFDVPGLKEALERITTRPMRACECVKLHGRMKFLFDNIKLESDDGRVVVKVKDESFELAYDKLIDEKTGQIKEIQVPDCIRGIGAGVFRDILKKANAQGKKIKKIVLPERLAWADECALSDVSVGSVVFKSNDSHMLSTSILKGALNVGAVFVPARYEEEIKADLKNKDIRVYTDFELKNAFDIEDLKDDIMDALANREDIKFENDRTSSSPILCVGDKEYHPDYSKLKDEKTGKIENLELPYGIKHLGSSTLILDMCKGFHDLERPLKIKRVVIPNTVLDIDKYVFRHINVNHLVLSKNLIYFDREAFGWTIKEIGFGNTFMGTMCNIKEITAPAKFEPKLKGIFKNQKTEFNLI